VSVPGFMEFEHKLTAMEMLLADRHELESVAIPSACSCPECGGVLYQLKDQRLLRFRCSQGHAWSSLSLLSALDDTCEEALHGAARALTEEAQLGRELRQKAPALLKDSLVVADSSKLAQHVRELQLLLTANDVVDCGINVSPPTKQIPPSPAGRTDAAA